MKLSERFINSIDGDGVISSENAHAIEDAVNFIRKYEDAEERGLLVHLPCKVGDTAYVIWVSSVIYPENPPVVREDHITQVKFTKKGICI